MCVQQSLDKNGAQESSAAGDKDVLVGKELRYGQRGAQLMAIDPVFSVSDAIVVFRVRGGGAAMFRDDSHGVGLKIRRRRQFAAEIRRRCGKLWQRNKKRKRAVTSVSSSSLVQLDRCDYETKAGDRRANQKKKKTRQTSQCVKFSQRRKCIINLLSKFDGSGVRDAEGRQPPTKINAAYLSFPHFPIWV